MKITTHAHGAISNAVYAYLTAGTTAAIYREDTPLSTGDLFVIDARSCPAHEVSLAFAPLLAGAGVLLLDASDEHKKALARHIGFRSQGANTGYFVSRHADAAGHVSYRIVEAGDSTSKMTSTSQRAYKDNIIEQHEVHPAVVAFEDVQQVHALTQADIDLFATTIASPVVLDASAPPPAQLVWKNWIYSRTHTFTAAGAGNSDFDAPPSKTISLLLTYTFQGALNNTPQTGPFQYLGLLETGIFQNNGMSHTSNTDFGWTIAAFNPTFAASSALQYFESSPSNTNDVAQVTTGSSVTVGFDASSEGTAGLNGSYTYSNATTKNISDWYITQNQSNNWLYAQNTPYDGVTTSFPSGGFNWFTGLIETGSFPVISTTSLQFAMSAVWKTNSVLTTEVDITVYNLMRVDYLRENTFLGLGTKGAFWNSTSVPQDIFSIDMSAL